MYKNLWDDGDMNLINDFRSIQSWHFGRATTSYVTNEGLRSRQCISICTGGIWKLQSRAPTSSWVTADATDSWNSECCKVNTEMMQNTTLFHTSVIFLTSAESDSCSHFSLKKISCIDIIDRNKPTPRSLGGTEVLEI